MQNRRVERMDDHGQWVETAFEDVYRGDMIRFFEGSSSVPMQQNGASVFVVVDKPRPAGNEGNCSVSVLPMGANGVSGLPVMEECPYWENIVVVPQGNFKRIEATGYCAECRCNKACLKAKYSAAYFDQLRDALGFNDALN